MKKQMPRLTSEDAEREFWATHDSTDYIDRRRGKRVTLPNLKPSSQTISLRSPKPVLDRLKLLANKRDVPYQSLLKMFVAERLKAEFESSGTDGTWRGSVCLRIPRRPQSRAVKIGAQPTSQSFGV
jgi:predicted DNA binding CopG/RHH family protein